MIPIKLTLKGIYSYIDTQVIEFEHLTDSALFGIFGSVGSGKSTILEAISFALYGETERLNKKDSRNYNMMNLKSNELLIDFEFYTINKDHRYRFIVKGKRNKKNFNDVKSFVRSSLAYNTKSNDEEQDGAKEQWIPTEETAEDIIGLNYNNFKRTIIIPQGKFKEFLELKPTERTDMLKDIFNLQQFDLAGKLISIRSENDEKIHTLMGKMEQYQNLNDETLAKKQLEEKQFCVIDAEQQKELDQLQSDFTTLTKLKELFDHFIKAKTQLDDLNNSRKLYDKRKQDLDDYSCCKTEFSELLNLEYRLQKEINRHDKQIQTLQGQLSEKLTLKTQLDKQLTGVKANYNKKDILLAEAHELELIISIRKSIDDNNTLIGRVKNGDKAIAKHKKNIEEKQLLREDEKSILFKLKETIPNLSELNNVKNYLIKQLDLDNLIKKINAQLNTFVKQVEQLKVELKVQLGDEFYATQTVEIKDKINIEIENLTQSKKQLSEQLNHLCAQEKLKQWADDLEDGKSCPVCGSHSHPEILNIDDLQAKITVHQDQIINFEKHIQGLKLLLNNVDKNEIELKNSHTLLDNTKQELIDSNTQVAEHKTNTIFQVIETNYKNETIETIDKLIQSTEKTDLKVKKTDDKINSFELEISKLQKQLATYTQAYQAFKDKHIALEATIKSEKESLKIFSMGQVENDADDVLKVMVQSRNEIVNKAIIDFDRLSKKAELLQTDIDSFKGQKISLSHELDEKSSLIEETKKDLANKLTKSNYESLDTIRSLLKCKINEQQENQAIANYEAQLKLATEEFERLQQSLDNEKDFDQDSFNKLKQLIEDKQNRHKKLSQQMAIIQNELKKLINNLKEKNKLDKYYKDLNKRKENIAVLSKLFKAQGFVNYISTVYLQNLSEAANERFFKMTRQQLQLEINDANEFQVRDYLNEGKIRSVKTLSGGQIFQASLALALALADSVQKQIKAEHNFFFLDEGFGALDDESLHIVFSALKSLKDENRIIGVISHVENLKQEIDVHIQVNKDEQQGSLINYSWV